MRPILKETSPVSQPPSQEELLCYTLLQQAEQHVSQESYSIVLQKLLKSENLFLTSFCFMLKYVQTTKEMKETLNGDDKNTIRRMFYSQIFPS